MVNLANWQQEEPIGCGGGRQLSMDGTSRVTGDSHARFCERLGVKFPGPTRRRPAMVVPTATLSGIWSPGNVCHRWQGMPSASGATVSLATRGWKIDSPQARRIAITFWRAQEDGSG